MTTVPRHHRDTTTTAFGGSYVRDSPHGYTNPAWLLDPFVSGPESAIYRFVQKNRGRLVREADRATEEAHKRCVDLIAALEEARGELAE